MNTFLLAAQKKLSDGSLTEAYQEMEVLEKLLAEAGQEKVSLARWEYEENKTAYVDPRSRAGLVLYHEDAEVFWDVTEQLVKSQDPDDRDTALTALANINDSKKYILIKLLLDDRYFYIQFEAIEQLMDQYPSEVLDRLNVLAKSENPHYRKLALEKLNLLK